MGQQIRFSQRVGARPLKEAIQIQSMDEELRNGVWNVLTICCWNELDHSPLDAGWSRDRIQTKGSIFFHLLWRNFYKWPLDEMPGRTDKCLDAVRDWFFGAEWHSVYDLLEFASNNFPFEYEYDRDNFVRNCNAMLERELSGYRFVRTTLTPITSEQELAALKDALASPDQFEPAREHLS